MRFVITAGPTREYLDDVRFLSNASSGRMGYAIAREAARRGHDVVLVSGPTALRPPKGVAAVSVVSTQEMYRAAARAFRKADCLIGAAAPADFRPSRRERGKVKKSQTARAIELVPTVDILATLGPKKGRRVVIAFALEVQRPVVNAIEKMRRKRADAIVLNAPSAMGARRSSATILLPDGRRLPIANAAKQGIARRIVSLAERLGAARHPRSGG